MAVWTHSVPHSVQVGPESLASPPSVEPVSSGSASEGPGPASGVTPASVGVPVSKGPGPESGGGLVSMGRGAVSRVVASDGGTDASPPASSLASGLPSLGESEPQPSARSKGNSARHNFVIDRLYGGRDR